MANYVNENEFRSCELNYLSNPTPFTNGGGKITLNPDYKLESSIFKRLAIDDTFHDLSKERNGYNKEAFNNYGPANYLLTGQFIRGDNISYFKNTINYDEFKSIPGGSFESNVTKSIEIKRGLQTADVTITYDDILTDFDLASPTPIGEKLKEKLILSGGSLRLSLNLNNPFIKKLKKTSITFSEYMIAISAKETVLKTNNLKISKFVRWFLHSDDMENLQSLATLNLPSEPMKILSDAGISFLGDFFGVEGSLVTPFIGVPCFLDSASTSTSVLDPNKPIYFEQFEKFENEEVVIPIVSNYFSCEDYFIGYLLNENSTFDKDNLYSFSLILFKIPEITPEITPETVPVRDAINYIRNSPSIFGESTNNYLTACASIKRYIDTYPESVARYFFGEVQKQVNIQQEPDDLKCGTCGAGVPYIGKIMDLLLTNIPDSPISGQWLSTDKTNLVYKLKQVFNTLKKSGPLNSRIPIADSRILKLFCYNTSLSNGTTGSFMNMTRDDFLSLFKILADYKRTGDYQQSYTVLKEILKTGSNAGCFTFCSGDELSTLVGRLLGVPSIYQVGVTSTCTLYRCNLLNASPAQKSILEIRNDKKIIQNYVNKISYKLSKIDFFIKNYYEKICRLRVDLQQFKEKIETIPTTVFTFITCSNIVYILSKLIKECNTVLTFASNDVIVGEVEQLYTENAALDTKLTEIESNIQSKTQQELDTIKLDVHNFLLRISQFEDSNIFSLFNTINDSGNLTLSLDNSVSFFEPLSEEEKRSFTFKRDVFGLNIKSGKDIVTKTKKMVEFINKRLTPQTGTRKRERGQEEKIKLEAIENNLFVSNYNDFIDSFKTSIFENGLDGDIKISDYESFNQQYITKLFETIKSVVDKEILDTECNPEIYHAINSKLSELFTRLRIEPQSDQRAGDSNYIDSQYGGGSEQDYNRTCIYNDIQKLLLNLTSKCARYCSNTLEPCISGEPRISQPRSFIDCIKYVSDNYETDDFCNQILFEQDDECTLESENLGFVIGLKILAEQYTYSDLLEDQPNNDNLLTINVMLDILHIPYVKLILILLTWSNIKNVKLLFDLIEYDTSFIDKYCVVDFTQQCFQDYIARNFREYIPIYNFLVSNEQLNSSLSIFSIIGLGVLNYVYYGRNSQCFYSELCDILLASIAGISSSSQGLIYLNLSPIRFLQDSLLLSLNNIYTYIARRLGQSRLATSSAFARGVRSRGNRSRGGFKKLKTIKNKRIKKIKRTRNYKKKYNKSIKIIKLNKKRKTRRNPK